ncbi:MAG: hypothetical protein ACK2UU_16510, partial [Anaerolineae bacterium]
MLHFKSLSDLHQLPATDPAYALIKQLVERCILPYDTPASPYRPEDEGWIVLIQEGDVEGPLT